MEAWAFIPVYGRDGVRAVALVDAADAARITRHRWHRQRSGYIARSSKPSGKRRTHMLHREILGLSYGDGKEADHRNRCRWDNRRSNLRIVSRAQNAQNLPSVAGATSHHRGVSWVAREQRWRAHVQHEGRFHSLGYFTDEDEAAEAARAWRREHMPYAEETAA